MGASRGGASMRGHGDVHAGRIVLVGLLCAGWLLGLLTQWASMARTGYADIYPPQMVLGVLLFVGAGAAERVFERVRRTALRGALVGVAMLVSILLGYLVLAALYVDPGRTGESGETPVSLLLEAPFWIGIPLVTSAASGLLGWHAADRLVGR
jgi:hypothetical protein